MGGPIAGENMYQAKGRPEGRRVPGMFKEQQGEPMGLEKNGK